MSPTHSGSRRSSAGLGRLLQGLLAGLLLALMSSAARCAEPLPEEVDLATLLQIARETSPRLAADRQAVASAEAGKIAAAAYPNPSLSYGRYRPSGGRATLFDGVRQEQAGIEVPLLLGGQRDARVARAEHEAQLARARVVAGESSLATEAAAAHTMLLAAQHKAELFVRTGSELQRLRRIVAERESSGVASRFDVSRIDLELGAWVARRRDAEAELADRSGTLALLLGLPGWRPRATGRLQALPLASMGEARERAATSPAAMAALREEELAQSAVEVARRERTPATSVSAAHAWTSQPHGAANFVGVTVEIPVLDTRRGAVQRAQADALAATLRRQMVQSESAAQIERLGALITARELALREFERQVGDRLEPVERMTEDAYQLGRAGMVDLLDSVRSRHELHALRIELTAALLEVQVRLLGTSGTLVQLEPAQTRK